MNRREFMACAVMLASNASLANMHLHGMSGEQKKYLASAENYNDWNGHVFNQQQKKIVKIIVGHIVPTTDTPGAVDAGVPQFVERMAQEWFTEKERDNFLLGLEHVEELSQQTYGKPYIAMNGQEQIELLEELEDAASDSDWYKYGNVMADFISDSPFICHIKELTLWGFFTSEVGSTQVLRQSIMTEFKGDIPLRADESSWDYLQI